MADLMGNTIVSNTKANISSGEYRVRVSKGGAYILKVSLDDKVTSEKVIISGDL